MDNLAVRTGRRDRLYMTPEEYEDYLASSHWQEVRRSAIRRAGYRCQVCNRSSSQLEVHHRTYENLGNEEEYDVIALCSHCHSIFHEFGRLE